MSCLVYVVFVPWLLHSSQACPNCFNNTCIDGECTHGCNNGYYGRNCDSSCRSQCVNNTCQLSPETGSARCSLGCANGWKGENCELRCSRRCNICNSTTCFKCTSYYWYGPQCRQFCHRCPENHCHRNGTCMYTYHASTKEDVRQIINHSVAPSESTWDREDVTVFEHEYKPTSTPAEDDVTSSDVEPVVIISPSEKFNVEPSCFIITGFGCLILISAVFIVLSLRRKKGRQDRHPSSFQRSSPAQQMEVIYDEIEFPSIEDIPRGKGGQGVYLTPLYVPQRPLPSVRDSSERS